MSLINDALKRAGQNSARPAPPPPISEAMCPAEKAVQPGLPNYVLPVALLIFCAALLILFKGLTAQKTINAVAQPPVVAARAPSVVPSQVTTTSTLPALSTTRPVASPARSATTTVSNATRTQPVPTRAATKPTAAVPVSVVARPAPTVVTSAPPATKPAVASAPPPQTYKLGGIFYRATNPSAVINNRTVYIGERVGNARVKSITRDAVALEFPGGQLLELTL
jgi:hypothetical protein